MPNLVSGLLVALFVLCSWAAASEDELMEGFPPLPKAAQSPRDQVKAVTAWLRVWRSKYGVVCVLGRDARPHAFLAQGECAPKPVVSF